MYLSYRKKLLGCLLVLLVCLWVVYQTTILAVKYEKQVNSLTWELDRCFHKQGLDSRGRLGSEDLYSQFTLDGYPNGLKSVSPAVFEHSPRLFTARATNEQRGMLATKRSTFLWPLSVTSDPWPLCSHYYDEGFVFALPNQSDGYSLLVNTLLPLYALISLRSHLGPRSPHGYSVVLMPAVESFEVQGIDWSTDVFGEQNKFSPTRQMLDTFAETMRVMPLSKATLHTGHSICFMSMHFGVGVVNISDPSLLRGFSLMMMSRLGLSLPQPIPSEPCVCLVKRTLNRRVLNTNELVKAVSGFVQIQVVQFEGLSYREQVSQMQRYTILVGFHGDELLNAIYMPRDSVTVQLLPFEPKGLNPRKYSDLARAHGPYLEWTNTIEENSRPSAGRHSNSNLVDTVVDVSAFVMLIRDALKLGVNKNLVSLHL